MIPELYDLSLSPWSLKARWALFHHDIAYKRISYVPGIGELLLRWRLRLWSGKVTVPVLITSTEVCRDSLSIAEWADAHSNNTGGSALIPEGKFEEVKKWEQRCNKVMEYNRGVFLTTAPNMPEVTRNLPPKALLQLPLGPWLASLLGSLILRLLAFKYRSTSHATSKQEAEGVLRSLKEVLKPGSYLCGSFSYADISAAVMIDRVNAMSFGTRKAAKEGTAPPASDITYLLDDTMKQYAETIFQKHLPPKCPNMATWRPKKA